MPSTSKKQARFMAAAAHSPAFAKKVGISQDVAKEFNQADKGRKFREGGATMVKRLFKGKETPAEEMKEAKALKSGKISPKQYAAGEKSEGHGKGAAAKAAAIKSGKMSPAAYAKSHAMKCGGKVKKYAEGGEVLPDYEREPSDEDKAQQGAAIAQYKVDKGMNPNLSDDMTFKEAFAAARKEGDKKFTWRGKDYSTELAKPKASFADKAKKAGFTSAETKGGAALMTRKDRAYKAGGSVRGCGCAVKGKTKGRMV